MSGPLAAGDPPPLESALAALVDAVTLARYRWVAPLGRGRRVLDAPCGVGRGAAILAEQGATEVVAVDETQARVEVAGSVAPGVSSRRVDLNRLPFPGGAFDIVVRFGAGQTAPTDQVRELLRVVRREGILFVAAPAYGVEALQDLLAENRGYTAVADQLELAGSGLDWGMAASALPANRLVRIEGGARGEGPVGGPWRGMVLMASDAPIPSLEPVAVTFDLGSADRWWRDGGEQERRIGELESRIRELEGELHDRDRLRSDLRAIEQGLAARVASYEESVQSASLQTAARYRNTVSWTVTAPLRGTGAGVKRLVRGIRRAAVTGSGR